jgi:branched-subunit amino acid ABC-type transport system permease component
MGFSPTLTAFVIAFLAGLQLKPLLLAGWALAIGLSEQYVTIWFDAAWSNLVVLVGLLVYLCALSWRTSGLRLFRKRHHASTGRAS